MCIEPCQHLVDVHGTETERLVNSHPRNESAQARLVGLVCLRPKRRVWEKTHIPRSGYALVLRCAAPNTNFVRPVCLPEAMVSSQTNADVELVVVVVALPAASFEKWAQ